VDSRIGHLRIIFALGLAWAAALAVLASRTGRFEALLGQEARGDPIHASMTREPSGGPPTTVPTGPAPPENRVGIIAGHWQFDTGAVCPDGLREVDVTTDVATRVKSILEARGFDVDVLPEHDPDVPAAPILGYRGAALVSIHADSCDIVGATGFKVARWTYTATPDADDRLVACLYKEYAAETLLPRHDSSITSDMSSYYALREIAPETPGAIIELGFLKDDRGFLDDHRYEAALGVANGIGCFLGRG
jgi:N-acetylmuramoyl-L-alanine amidase